MRATVDHLPVADARERGDDHGVGIALVEREPDLEANTATARVTDAGIASSQLRAGWRRWPPGDAPPAPRGRPRHQRGPERRALRPTAHTERRGVAAPAGDLDWLLREGRDVPARASARLDTTGARRDVHLLRRLEQPDDNLYQPSPARDKLSALARSFEDLSWVPTTSWADATPRTYLATFYRLFVQPLRNLSSPPGAPSDVDQLWPFTPAPEAIGDPVTGAPSWRCAVLDLGDAEMFGRALAPRAITRYSPGLRTISVSLAWSAGNGLMDMQMTALFPHETPTCVGAQP
jgi:hypothetical protein